MPGYVKRQNFWFWAANNPCERHQWPLHSVKATVWFKIQKDILKLLTARISQNIFPLAVAAVVVEKRKFLN
jgi:hypothetical protein